MLKTLLKKQMADIFRSYLYDTKKNEKRSKGAIIMFIALFVLLMVGLLGGMFTFFSIMLCEPMVSVGMDWLYFVLMGMLAIFLGAFGSVFNTYSGLYLSKDNDLLLSLPIPVRCIMTSRLLGVYLMGLMYSAVVIVPSVIVYWCVAPFSIAAVIGSVMLIILVSLIVMILSCVLGWVVAKVSLKLKNKSFITVVISLFFFAAYYFFYFKSQELINTMVENAALYGGKIKSAAYPLYLFGCIGTGDALAIIIFTVAVSALFALMWYVLSHSFIKIATSSGKTSRVAYKEKIVKSKSIFGAVLSKEFKRFTASPNYMLNCGLGTLLLPIGGVLMLIKGGEFADILNEIFGMRGGSTAVLICTAVCMVASMNDMAAPSVSLEGSSLWLMQSLPIMPWQALRAKLSVQLILTALPVIFCDICIAFVLPCTPAELALFIIVSLLYVVLSAEIDLSLGIKMPNLTWTNEIAPIKQSGSVMLAMFNGWAYAAVLAGVYMFVGWRIGAVLYFTAVAVVTAALAVMLYMWLKNKGTKVFAAL